VVAVVGDRSDQGGRESVRGSRHERGKKGIDLKDGAEQGAGTPLERGPKGRVI